MKRFLKTFTSFISINERKQIHKWQSFLVSRLRFHWTPELKIDCKKKGNETDKEGWNIEDQTLDSRVVETLSRVSETVTSPDRTREYWMRNRGNSDEKERRKDRHKLFYLTTHLLHCIRGNDYTQDTCNEKGKSNKLFI